MPFEPVPSVREQALVIETLVRRGWLRWRWLPVRGLPKGAFDKRYGRYRAERILAELSHLCAQYDHLKGRRVAIIGVTKADISTEIPGFLDHAVLGFAEAKGCAMVLSTARLPTSARQKAWRSLILHEWGHWMGLGHCRRSGCAMFDRLVQPSNAPWSRTFCSRCASLLSRGWDSSVRGSLRPRMRSP